MNPYIQVFMAIVIVIILLITGFFVYNKEMINAIRQTGTIKRTTPIFKGIIDFSDTTDIHYDTINPNAPNYINMGSSNQSSLRSRIFL
jgi:regulator of protease activity HflC (stomatin/prohibitin superfamily)